MSEGDLHHRQRRIVQPRFTRNHIQRYAEQMTQIAHRHTKRWVDGESRVLTEDLFAITFDIIAQTMFSFESGDQLERIGRTYDSINRISVEKMRSLVRLPLFVPTAQNREYLNAIKVLDRVVYGLIAERRAKPDAATQDLLSVLLAAVDEQDQMRMTDSQVRDELMSMLLAGHETTANTVAWAYQNIAAHPEVEEKLVEEWSRVLGGRKPTSDDYSLLTYTQNVLWETLRLRPAGYLTGRTAIRDVQIGSLRMREDEMVMISPYPLHMNAEYFEAPDRFRPERFENDFVKTLPMMANFPFGAGPRSCIGNHYAMLEMVMVLCTIGQHFKLKLASGHPPIVPEALLTLRPKGGIRVTVHSRSL